MRCCRLNLANCRVIELGDCALWETVRQDVARKSFPVLWCWRWGIFELVKRRLKEGHNLLKDLLLLIWKSDLASEICLEILKSDCQLFEIHSDVLLICALLYRLLFLILERKKVIVIDCWCWPFRFNFTGGVYFSELSTRLLYRWRFDDERFVTAGLLFPWRELLLAPWAPLGLDLLFMSLFKINDLLIYFLFLYLTYVIILSSFIAFMRRIYTHWVSNRRNIEACQGRRKMTRTKSRTCTAANYWPIAPSLLAIKIF